MNTRKQEIDARAEFYIDEDKNTCTGLQLFNFFKDARKKFTTYYNKVTGSGAAGPSVTDKGIGDVLRKSIEIWFEVGKPIKRKNRIVKSQPVSTFFNQLIYTLKKKLNLNTFSFKLY